MRRVSKDMEEGSLYMGDEGGLLMLMLLKLPKLREEEARENERLRKGLRGELFADTEELDWTCVWRALYNRSSSDELILSCDGREIRTRALVGLPRPRACQARSPEKVV